ncbi:hypothetical protein GGR56DRAFT_614303 [Xylariaceae sp. FL0804]|nr:hypothetical protein GGR56DRAFT_614303 [Xylariaceae sp. FL0804]
MSASREADFPSTSPGGQKEVRSDTGATPASAHRETSVVPPTPPGLEDIPAAPEAPHSTSGEAPPAQGIRRLSVVTAADAARDSTVAAAAPDVPPRRPSVSIPKPKMLFSDLYKSSRSPLLRLRQASQQPAPVGLDFDPDLVSRDKAKQKEAVRRSMAARVRNDWEFKWPPVTQVPLCETKGSGPTTSTINDETPTKDRNSTSTGVEVQDDDDSVAEMSDEDDIASVYSTVSEDAEHFTPRAEWLSDLSEDEREGRNSPSAYRFENPDSVGNSIKAAGIMRSAKRRRAVRAEMQWNQGLACFSARRDAWTGAKVARVRPKVVSSPPTSPGARRLSIFRLSGTWTNTSPAESTSVSPVATRTSGETTAIASSDAEASEPKAKQDSSLYPVETLLPRAPPILPPANPMRASITPASYSSVYDKIVVHSMTPACPVNLSDVMRSCVVGWKRDGEWPPRAAEAPPVVAVRKKKKREESAGERPKPNGTRRMSFNFLGRRQSTTGDLNGPAVGSSPQAKKEDEPVNSGNKGVRRSLQRVLGLGNERRASNAGNYGTVA